MSKFGKYVAAFFVIPLLISPSQKCFADLILQFSPDNSVPILNVKVNDVFKVNLYLAQTAGENRLLSDGLLSFGIRSRFDPSKLSSVGGTVSPNFPFNDTPDVNATVAGQADMYGGSLIAPTNSIIYLGTFEFQSKTVGNTTLIFGDLDNAIDDFTLNDIPIFSGLDIELFGTSFTNTYEINVNTTAIPEPNLAILTISMFTAFKIIGSRKTKAGQFGSN